MTETPTITPCGHCGARRFEARGALWCTICDRQTADTLAARTEVRR